MGFTDGQNDVIKDLEEQLKVSKSENAKLESHIDDLELSIKNYEAEIKELKHMIEKVRDVLI